jgi:hypothetical protein
MMTTPSRGVDDDYGENRNNSHSPRGRSASVVTPQTKPPSEDELFLKGKAMVHFCHVYLFLWSYSSLIFYFFFVIVGKIFFFSSSSFLYGI